MFLITAAVIIAMLIDFRCKETQALFEGRRVARFANIEAAAMRKLQQLHAATDLAFLRVPPGNQLEPLKGDRTGQHSIRINGQGACALSGSVPMHRKSKSWITTDPVYPCPP